MPNDGTIGADAVGVETGTSIVMALIMTGGFGCISGIAPVGIGDESGIDEVGTEATAVPVPGPKIPAGVDEFANANTCGA